MVLWPFKPFKVTELALVHGFHSFPFEVLPGEHLAHIKRATPAILRHLGGGSLAPIRHFLLLFPLKLPHRPPDVHLHPLIDLIVTAAEVGVELFVDYGVGVLAMLGGFASDELLVLFEAVDAGDVEVVP